jgi:micrococcal nuclease
MRPYVAITAAAAFAAVLVVGSNATPNASGQFTLRGTVTRVVDGDTIDVRLSSGKTERVRIIGVDSPERGACYAARAAAQTNAMTLRKRVGLVGDRTQARRDRYGRLLAYVSAPRRPDVGRRLLEGGFARVLVGRPFQRVTSYRAAERGARTSAVGMWSACGAGPPPPPVAPPPPPPVAPPPPPPPPPAEPPPPTLPPPPGRCHPSYPDFCIPPSPPDLDCGDFTQRNFRVLWTVPDPDPHRLDGDRDGIACES